MGKSKVIGLVLSGGGFRGIAHIGAIRAMEENGLEGSISPEPVLVH